MIDRHIPDFCNDIDKANEPWYIFTSHFKQRSCPYEAGYQETFDNEEWKKLSPLVTYNFIGKYRATFFSYFKNEDRTEQTDCWRIGFEIMDF